jgi:hypothetical protein
MFKNNIVKKSDFLNAFGINLDLELGNDDNNNNKAERFIWRVENYCKGELSHYAPQEINENNIEQYKLGVMLMMYHCLNVGYGNLNGLTRDSYNAFRFGGFCNRPKGELYG